MPLLPVVCIVCKKVIRRIEVSRKLRPNDSSSGVCEEHTRPVQGLFGFRRGPVVGTILPRFCGCGRELITARQIMDGRCEYCTPATLDVERLR